MSSKQILLCGLAVIMMLLSVTARPDGGDSPPLPGPGLAYGGIPYGSVSGDVAKIYEPSSPSAGRSANYASNSGVDYTPIQKYL